LKLKSAYHHKLLSVLSGWLAPRFSMTIAMKDSTIPIAVSPAKLSMTVLIFFFGSSDAALCAAF